MSKPKKIECELYRYKIGDIACLHQKSEKSDDWHVRDLWWECLRKVAPGLTKALRPGQSRKLILTQTPTGGIQLERAEK